MAMAVAPAGGSLLDAWDDNAAQESLDKGEEATGVKLGADGNPVELDADGKPIEKKKAAPRKVRCDESPSHNYRRRVR